MKKALPVPTADEINKAHEFARESAGMAVEWAVKCGLLLAAKKDELGRGNFDTWVEGSCNFGRSSAYAYMKVADKSSRGLDDLKSIQQALGYDKPKPEPKPKELPQGAVPVVNPKGTGETGIDRPAAPISAEPVDPDEPERPEWEPDEDAALEQAEKEYAASIDKVMEADDKLAAAHAEIKRQAAEIASLKLSRNGFQNQNAELIRKIKTLQRENDRLKRRAA